MGKISVTCIMYCFIALQELILPITLFLKIGQNQKVRKITVVSEEMIHKFVIKYTQFFCKSLCRHHILKTCFMI